MLRKNAVTGAPAHPEPIFLWHRLHDVDNLMLVFGQENLFASGKKFIQASPGIGKDC
jgi:hypothetical protein